MTDFNFTTKTQATKENNYKVVEQTYNKEYEINEIEADKINRLLKDDVILEITDAHIAVYQRELRKDVVTTVRYLSFDEIALLKDKPKSDVSLKSLLLGIAIIAIPFAAVLGSIELKVQQFNKEVEVKEQCAWVDGVNTDDYLCGKDLTESRKLPEWKETDYRR